MPRTITTEQLSAELSAHIKADYGTLATAAKCWNLTVGAVGHYTRGFRPIPDFILKEMGYERAIVYRKIKK